MSSLTFRFWLAADNEQWVGKEELENEQGRAPCGPGSRAPALSDPDWYWLHGALQSVQHMTSYILRVLRMDKEKQIKDFNRETEGRCVVFIQAK